MLSLSLALWAGCAAAGPVDMKTVRENIPHQQVKRFESPEFTEERYTFGKKKVAEQVHIAYAGQNADGYPTGMNVGWMHSEEKDCTVKYGLSADALTETSDVAEKKRYLHDENGYHYNVDILSLKASTRYFYAIDCLETTETFSFTTAHDSKDLPKEYNIAIFGDMGWLGSDERPMVLGVDGLQKHWDAKPVRALQEAHLRDGSMDAMWIVGDIGYADDAFAHDVVGGLYEKCYNGYMNWMQNMSSVMPFHASPGNHESECHSTECVLDVFLGERLANFSAYNNRWNMPSKSSNGVANMWYSWNVGPVHFVSINTETDFDGAGEETHGDSGIFPAGSFGRQGEYLEWLENDLKQAYADKKSGKRPFIVAGGHRPCCQPGNLSVYFDKYEVDLYVAGHAHTYARSVQACAGPPCHTTYNTTYETSYIYSGACGNDETGIEGTTSGPTSTDPTGIFATPEQSLGMLTIMNSSTLKWTLQSAYGALRTIDQFYIHSK